MNFMKKKLKEIESELDEFYKRTGQGRLEQLEILQTIQRPYSTVTFLQAKTLSRTNPLVMKTVKHHPINRIFTEQENQAVVEFNILEYLYPKFQAVQGCSVPQPILVFPEIEAYLMGFVEGSLLMNKFKYTRVWSPRKEFSKLRTYVKLSGRWLKKFQIFTGFQTVDHHSLKVVIDRAKHRLKLIRNLLGPKFPEKLHKEIWEFIRIELNNLGGKEFLISGRHGDFTPLNMIAGHEGLTVIDFLGYGKDPVPVDILKIMVFLENEARSISSSPNRVKELKAAFLEGYGSLPQVPLPVWLICEAMQRIISIWGHLSNRKQLPHHRLEAKMNINAHIRWLMKRDKKPSLDLIHA